MKEFIEPKTTNYPVTQQTKRFINALEDLLIASNSLYDALCEQYGDEMAANLYGNTADLFNQIQNRIGEYLAISISENFGFNQNKK